MAVWKAAFAALSLFSAVEGFMNPTVNRVFQPPRMTATMDAPVGTIATENIRNIAGAYLLENKNLGGQYRLAGRSWL